MKIVLQYIVLNILGNFDKDNKPICIKPNKGVCKLKRHKNSKVNFYNFNNTLLQLSGRNCKHLGLKY